MRLEDLLEWIIALFGGLMICGAKLAYMLYGISTEPPTDPDALKSWERKRRWMVTSELAALPAFAALAVIIGRMRDWPIEGVVLFSMVLGALGFAFFLDALQTIIRRRIGMEGNPNG